MPKIYKISTKYLPPINENNTFDGNNLSPILETTATVIVQSRTHSAIYNISAYHFQRLLLMGSYSVKIQLKEHKTHSVHYVIAT